ncbi:hypothetical protein [Clostridioides sp. GD02404]
MKEHYSIIQYGFELWKVENELDAIVYQKLDLFIEKITERYYKTEE